MSRSIRRSVLACCCCCQQQVKENKETLGTTIEKSVTLGLEVKERGKEITTLRKLVATLKKEKEVKTVGKEVGVQVEAPTIMIEQRGTQVEQRTYADVLAQTEIMVSVVATTDRMDLDEPTTTMIPAAPPAAKDQPLPVPVPAARAFVVHSVACAGPFTYKIQEVERAFRGKGGGVIGV